MHNIKAVLRRCGVAPVGGVAEMLQLFAYAEGNEEVLNDALEAAASQVRF